MIDAITVAFHYWKRWRAHQRDRTAYLKAERELRAAYGYAHGPQGCLRSSLVRAYMDSGVSAAVFVRREEDRASDHLNTITGRENA